MNILNYGVYFTLDNGFESYTEIDVTTKEGLEHGFIDIYEVIDMFWILTENEFNGNVCINSWEIKRLPSEDITYLDMEEFKMDDSLSFAVDSEEGEIFFNFKSCNEFIQEFENAYQEDNDLSCFLYNSLERVDIGNQIDIPLENIGTVQDLYNVLEDIKGVE